MYPRPAMSEPKANRARRTWLALFALFAVVLAASPARAGETTLERIRRTGVLHWGGDVQGGEPYAYQDDRGTLTGFEVDLAAALARELGARAEFVQNDWSNLVPSLERETFDVALNGLEITESMRGRVLFSRPYCYFAERLMARRGDASIAADATSLSGKRVGTLMGSMARELLLSYPGVDIVLYEGTEEPYIDLVHGRVDAVLLDDIIAHRYGEARAELRVVGDLAEGAYAVGMRPADTDLAAAVDRALDGIARSGELERILRREGVWSERQAKLAKAPAATDDDGARARQGATHRLTWRHVTLFLQGAGVTFLLSVCAMALAVPLGMALALARLYAPRWCAVAAGAYVEIFRGTPVLLQLYVLYYGLSPVVRIGAFPAAILGLGLNYAAYEAEVYRAGVLAVPAGQMEAAQALGMKLPLALRRVILPQAMRYALPNVTNDFIALLKDSSLVSVITVVELTKQMTITAVDLRGWLVPGALCAGLYFAMSYPLSRWARRMEARLARG